MTRPHIEFIHAQQLDWAQNVLPGPWGELDCKTLSSDPDTGACSMLLRYPAGWRRDGVEHLDAALEFLILEGNLTINEQDYGLDCYAYLPRGMTYRSVTSSRGAVALTFFDARPTTHEGEGAVAEDPNAPAVPYINLHDMPWSTEGIDPDIARNRYIAHKRLRHNPETGDTTFVLEGGAHSHADGWQERELRHPCVEEMYLLSGDIVGPQGVIRGGGYFWRPPDIWHGPFASRMGYLGLFRFLDGHHVNIWSDESRPISLTPAHRPVLPPDLQRTAGKPLRARQPF